MRWEAMRDQGYAVPNERFFVRNHTSTPRIDPATWRLRAVRLRAARGPAARSFSLADLHALPARERDRVHRVCRQRPQLLREPAGHAGARDAVEARRRSASRAGRGVPLAEVLERAGLRRRAVDVMPEGLDPNVVTDGVDHGHVRRPLPIGKALDDALLAYEMNGEALPPDHGAPLRLVVPGWIGVASVKWVGAIEVSDAPLASPWNTKCTG